MTRPKSGWMLLLALAGCGNAASGNYEPAYFSIKGTVENKGAAVPSAQPHVAFLWWAENATVAQDVAIQSTFPANYQIDVKRLPPPEVIRQPSAKLAQTSGVDANMRWAVGQLVVYADDNGN